MESVVAKKSCEAPRRPVCRYHGGKWKLAPWIIGHFPPHSVYVEPFGGAGSVLLRKPRSVGEVYNDLDGEIVGVFRVLRDPGQARELARLLRLTPYARDEFHAAYEPCEDPVEQARRTLVRAAMGHGTAAIGRRSKVGFRTKRAGKILPSSEFASWTGHIERITARLAGVVIENRPALDVVKMYDATDVLFFVDPPYLASTRSGMRAQSYAHEMSDDEHVALAEALLCREGMVIVSGYRSPLYAELYEARGWRRVDVGVFADRAAPRTESLWLSPKVQPARGRLL